MTPDPGVLSPDPARAPAPASAAATASGSALTIIVPVLNEGGTLARWLRSLGRMCPDAQLVLVDGGSTDDTAAVARTSLADRGHSCDRVISSPRGRARQMNAGAAVATGDVLLFLHADTRLPTGAPRSIGHAVAAGAGWGRFDVRIDSPRRSLRMVSWMMNERSHRTGVATGDQAIFVRRDLFERTGGYPDLPLMEDIALSKLLRRRGRPARIRSRVVTSPRRWESNGTWRTIALMWRLRLEYVLGADPEVLALRYGSRAPDAEGS